MKRSRCLTATLVAGTAAMAARAQPPPRRDADRAALARIEQLNPRVNAVIAVDPTAIDQARALDRMRRARGPLFGMPILIKDNIETAGPLPTTAGSLALADNVTHRDAPLVARLRAAGAVILGKTNLSEWANIRSNNSISGWSAVGGQVRNPYALNRNPCGSSSGSGAAVAAGMVPAAIGTETDGSITCPAAINGIVGFKPTVGLVSRTYVVPISHSQDTPGPMTPNVRDAALVLNAIAGSDPADPATAEADAHRVDYAAAPRPRRAARRAHRRDALRLGLRHRRGVRGGARRAARAGRDAGRHRRIASGRQEMGRNELVVLLAELKADMNAYLATTPRRGAHPHAGRPDRLQPRPCRRGDGPVRAGIVRAGARRRTGSTTAYRTRARRPASGSPAATASTSCCTTTMSSPWSARPCRRPGRSTRSMATRFRAAAPAASPRSPAIRTSPCRWARCAGFRSACASSARSWDDARILALGYAYEQASHRRVAPRFLRSIEESPEIAPHLRPHAAQAPAPRRRR